MPSNHPGRSRPDGWLLGGDGGNGLSLNLDGAGAYQSGSNNNSSPSTDNQWHHVASTFDGSSRKLYLDGVEVSSVSTSGSISPTVAGLVLGAVDLNTTQPPAEEIKAVVAANHSKIKLDEVRIYDTALSSTEVSELYNFGKGDLQKVGGFSTLPSVINANAGTALSTTITADFPNAVYSAYNLPDGLSFTGGLSINSATGEISGTPTVGGTHTITVVAQGGTNDAPKKTSSTIIYSAGSTLPKYGSAEATNIVGDSALLLAEIEQSGADSNTVDFIWDTADRGANAVSDWNGSALSVGTGKEGFYGKQLNNLTPGQTYYYRAKTSFSQNPKNIGGNDLKVWLDASDLSETPDPWTDKSGNGNSPSKNGSPSVVSNSQNSLNVLRFDSLNSEFYNKTSANLTNGDQTWMLLIKPLGAGSATNHTSGGILSWVVDGNNFWVFQANDSSLGFKGRVRHKSSGTFRLTSATPATTSNWTLFEIAFDRTNNRFYSWRNGTVLDNGVTHSYGLGDNAEFRIMRGSNSRNVAGDVAEIIAYKSVDSAIRLKMEGYLLHKWGLASNLPANHSYKSEEPSTSAWSSTVKSFTTPTNTTAPTLGSQSTANITATTADLEVVLTDNGNAATTVKFYWGDNDGDTK